MLNSLTDVTGIKIGHVTDLKNITGCTVVLCEKGAVGGIDQRGGAPGTRETDLLHPLHLVQDVHGILLTGGSAFGLDAASGVMEYLEKKHIGFDTGITHVPIVPAAVIYDLGIGNSHVRPDRQMGFTACRNAVATEVHQGNIGAGTGACVGSMFGPDFQMKGGLGMASRDLGKGLVVGALMVVNAFGDVIDPRTGTILAGARRPPNGSEFADTLETMRKVPRNRLAFSKGNTVIGVVATNAKLTKEEVNKVAQMAHNGIAKTIRPAHTMLDGDTIFSLATGQRKADVSLVGAYAAEMVSEAIISAVRHAKSIGGRIAATDISSEER
ncbi:P1 family peptidase [Candidatus Roizmanbacteria bacterium]|nr:P1 family peptidase [Candidatus Roizmanbacteria bacterium]